MQRSTRAPPVSAAEASADNAVCLPGWTKVSTPKGVVLPSTANSSLLTALIVCVVVGVAASLGCAGLAEYTWSTRKDRTVAIAASTLGVLLLAGIATPSIIGMSTLQQGTSVTSFVGCAQSTASLRHTPPFDDEDDGAAAAATDDA